jgi:Glycosyltransferase family 87
MREAMLLTQTHAIFLLLSLAAILYARSGRPMLAGVLLAVAAAVKITPGAIVLYWLITRRNRAALSFVVSLLVLLGSTVAFAGHDITVAYLHSMSRVSNVLLLSANNQSLAAWLMQDRYPAAALSFRSLLLPAGLKLVCLGLVALSAIAGGVCDRRLAALDASLPPYGAVFALVGATVFTPIAWSHYYLVLVVPLILLLDDHLRRRSYVLLLLCGSMVALASSPSLLRHVGYMHLPVPPLVRGQFYAGVLALTGMLLLYRRRVAERSRTQADAEATAQVRAV